MTRTIVRLYDNFSEAREAVANLVKAGFNNETISLVARDADGRLGSHLERSTTQVEAAEPPESEEEGALTGGLIGGLAGMLLGLGIVAIPGVGPVLAAGPLAAALMGAGAGSVTGSLIGSIAEWDVPEAEAEYYAEQVRQGGTLVSVVVPEDQANRAASIMDRYHPVAYK
jgi:hypothetical protein